MHGKRFLFFSKKVKIEIGNILQGEGTPIPMLTGLHKRCYHLLTTFIPRKGRYR